MSDFTTSVRKNKIAYVIDALSMGGAERLMVPILKHLDREKFEPYVCALQSKDGNPMAEEIRRWNDVGPRYGLEVLGPPLPEGI